MSMDCFIVPTLTGLVLFVLVLLSRQRRRIVHVAITDHPTAAWTAQQVIEASRGRPEARRQPGERLRFPREPRQPFGIARERLGQDLQRHVAIELISPE